MPHLRAWRPRLDGVAEVLHARFSEHTYPMHAHDTWTVLLVDDGAVRYDLDRHQRGAFGDLVTVLPPRVPHNGTSARPGGFRKRVLYLDADRLPARLIGASVDAPAINDRELRHAISRVHRLIRSPGDAPLADSLLAVTLARLRTHLGDPPDPRPPNRAAAHSLRDLLEQHIVAGLPLSTAAAALHFDPTHLVRSFRREFGMSPHQYLISRRVDLARRLILAGEPLRAVAAGSGFHDQPHLNRHFKRILGVTPGRYAGTPP
ncbi:AraC family transcriptional regulator [Actinoplanes sp. NEAU-A12]|uniref:AraC family transcriptional regulator n=1 Tax=Actinoplanes sandaracinus TaxID=3045177 RepID=A0ABT6X0D1_9ACTN|nr:AraC family transcriptional regulator [Actinoplanes sandaracinus]MDI6105466.1 AraC family transcriptional regulator [Actinoplanes sandaracinus]